jgi:hypothetical protein
MKAIVAIVCGLTLMLGQLFPARAASGCAPVAKADCGCGGKMACCAEKSAASNPVPATPARGGSENQSMSSIPVAAAWVLPAAGTVAICPANHFSAPQYGAPIFARNCARLI